MFPFTIKFEENICIDLNKIGVENVLDLIKENTINESDKEAKKFEIKNSTLKFRIRSRRMFSDFESVRKGEFNISMENNVTTLTYKYFVGNSIYFFLGICGLFTLISLFAYKNQDHNRITFIILWATIWTFLVWLAALLHQYLFFRRIVKRIEEKWVY